jgi:hypothetical protein
MNMALKNKKIILHLANNIEATKPGGVETFFQNFTKYLDDYEHIVIGNKQIFEIGTKLGFESYNFSFNRGHGGKLGFVIRTNSVLIS